MKKKKKKKLKKVTNNAGGAATAAGMNYQHRAAAWFSVRILAEKDSSPLYGLPTTVTLERVSCEARQPVDDINVFTSIKGRIFCQAKHGLSLGKTVQSDFASVIQQFVKQFLNWDSVKGSEHPEPPDHHKDRISLLVGPKSPQTIKIDLSNICSRARNLSAIESLSTVAHNKSEKSTLATVKAHIVRAWELATGSKPTDAKIKSLFQIIHIQTLDLDEGGTNEREACDLLRTILKEPDQANAAWMFLISTCQNYATGRTGNDRIGLQDTLRASGFPSIAARSYRDDIERLQNYTRHSVQLLFDLSVLKSADRTIKICRQTAAAIRDESNNGHLLIIGDPGAGKSGAIYDFIAALQNENKTDFLVILADRITVGSYSNLRDELNIEHDLLDVIKNWTDSEEGYLIIDALDAARADATARVLRDLISLVILSGNKKWRIVASIRKFDLRYSPELQRIFLGHTKSPFFDPEFKNVRHVNVPRLTDDEFGQLEIQSASLHALAVKSSALLTELLRLPFNLRVAADMLGDGVPIDSLAPIQTQVELLDRYWQRRVVREDGLKDLRESILLRACRLMIEKRALRVLRQLLITDTNIVSLNYLLSANVMSEWQNHLTMSHDGSMLIFSHHVLFDYAVARLLLRVEDTEVLKLLTEDSELSLVVRPSLDLHFQFLWQQDPSRKRFWKLVVEINAQ